MARDKDKSVNPATAHLRAQKARQLKKGRAEALTRRNEKLARRNPDRLQRQIDDLKALESSGAIKLREKQILEELEQDLRAVKKAREVLGDKAPGFGQGPRRPDKAPGDVLGKRKWDSERKPRNAYRGPSPSSGSETDESIRRIPMPRDTPPPIPRRYHSNAQQELAGEDQTRQPHVLPQKPTFAPPIETKSTYESAPQMRNLRQEAVSRFLPNVVRQKREAATGQGKLVEPEEMDKLEQSGYTSTSAGNVSSVDHQPQSTSTTNALLDLEARRLAAEEEKFKREMEIEMEADGSLSVQENPSHSQRVMGGPSHHVEMEEVEDGDS